MDGVKIMPSKGIGSWIPGLSRSLGAKVIENVDGEANSRASSDEDKKRTPARVDGQTVYTNVHHGKDTGEGKAKYS